MSVTLQVFRLEPSATMPQYQTEGAAGLDLHAAEATTLGPGQSGLVKTGIAVMIPPGYEGQVRPRSGLALRRRVTVLNAPGTIDHDYRGEVKVLLINHGEYHFHVEPGDRIAQLVLSPVARARVEEITEMVETYRGAGGFGSTGTR